MEFLNNLFMVTYNASYMFVIVGILYFIIYRYILNSNMNEHNMVASLRMLKFSAIVIICGVIAVIIAATLKPLVNTDTSKATRYNEKFSIKAINTSKERSREEFLIFKREPTDTK